MPPVAMTLSDQERRCIDLACRHLSNSLGGEWRLIEELDSAFPNLPSPEAIIGDGTLTAAIEVKRLTGDSIDKAYNESIFSLERSLAPSCGGYYRVNPPVDLRLPVDQRLRRSLKSEIERVAPTLSVEQTGILRIPRTGYAVHRLVGPNYAHCLHNRGRSLLAPLTKRIAGSIFLIDHGLEHSFHTDDGVNEFLRTLEVACREGRTGSTHTLTWHEEWELTKTDDESDPGVWIICVTEARDVSSSVGECLDTMLSSALRKFETRRWADLHIVVLDSASALMTAERTLPLLTAYAPDELPAVDLVLLANEGRTHAAFTSDKARRLIPE